MKLITPLLSTLLLFALPVQSISQELLKENRIWTYIDTLSGFTIRTNSYKIGEEVIEDGQTYRRLLKTQDPLQIDDWNYIPPKLREDSLNHVYIKYSGEEVLLYDFNLFVGDTIKRIINGSSCTLIVETVDSVEIVNSGEYLKRITFTHGVTYPAEVWVEGIGSSKGLVRLADYCYVVGPPYLSCVFDEGELTYQSENFEECIISVSSDDLNVLDLSLNPNPTSRYLNITTNEKILNTYVYTLEGKILVTSDQKSIDLKDLSPGLYFIRVDTGGNRSKVFKVIKN